MRSHILSALCLLTAATHALPAPQAQDVTTAATATSTSSSSSTATPTPYDFTAGAVTSFPIHESCNSTLRRQLERALDETVELAAHARNHILRFGSDSPFVQKYFGTGNGTNGTTLVSTAAPLGWYSRIVAGDRGNMTFRCDDPDRNCETQDGWAGHWRGANATQETVICQPSYEKRRWLDSVCGLGHTVVGSPLNTFWATDLLHRVLHVPRISEGVVEHFAEDYEGVLELAKTEPEKSGIDSDTLQYFAIDVYAFDVAAPGVGCTGDSE